MEEERETVRQQIRDKVTDVLQLCIAIAHVMQKTHKSIQTKVA